MAIFGLTALWAVFQWRDPTPPPALDQILVAAYGVWFAAEAIDNRRKDAPPRRVITHSDGRVTVEEVPRDNDVDADAADPKEKT